MKRLLLIATLLFPTVTVAAADSVQIYRPEPVTGPLPSSPEEGIAIKTITIKKGESLSKLSRRFSGKGNYFPQILLFNRISDPNRIIAGATLRVPLHPSETTSALSPSRPETVKRVTVPPSTSAAAARPATTAEELYHKAMVQYRKKRFRSALGLFDRILREYPDSPRAGDAIFHRGECYYNLSRR
jgi:TolA-binding protein